MEKKKIKKSVGISLYTVCLLPASRKSKGNKKNTITERKINMYESRIEIDGKNTIGLKLQYR